MGKKKRTTTSRATRTRAATTTFTGTARISGYVSSNNQDVPISPRAGNRRRHAVFSFTAVPQTFIDRFVHMASKSMSPWSNTYPSEPTLLQVARDFVRNELSTGWAVGSVVGSCWTPTGWQQPGINGKCQSFGLLAGGAEVALPLSRDEPPRGLRLRFAVSVEITP